MDFVRMPGAIPDQYVVVTIHNDGMASISIFGAPEDPAPVERQGPENALGLAKHMAAAHGFPLYIYASDEQWDERWGRLRDSFVERYH